MNTLTSGRLGVLLVDGGGGDDVLGTYVERTDTTSFKTPPPPYRLFDLQDSPDKRIHFPPQLSDFVPLRNGFYSVRAQTD